MKVTRTRFDALCGRSRETARLIEQGETPEPLFEIPSPRTDQDAGPARREVQPRNSRS
jgi:hypothetical protein